MLSDRKARCTGESWRKKVQYGVGREGKRDRETERESEREIQPLIKLPPASQQLSC
jgi:hypothetical protein